MNFVYRLISPSGRSYVGQTSRTPEQRWKGHIRGHRDWVKKGRPNGVGCTALMIALDKYPPDEWQLEVLCEGIPDSEIDTLEVTKIAEYDCLKNGYNISEGGVGCRGYRHTDKTKAKLSALHKGKPKSAEHRAKVGRKGRISPRKGAKLTEEQRARISASKKGKKQKTRVYTPEGRQKMLIAQQKRRERERQNGARSN